MIPIEQIEDVLRPYFYPLIGPTGEGVTRNFPMSEGVADEAAEDHPVQERDRHIPVAYPAFAAA